MRSKSFLSISTVLFGLFCLCTTAFGYKNDIENSIMDKNGHFLIKEWQDYYNAEAADLPRKQLGALDQIIVRAEKARYDWDYYDAQRKYYTVISQMDWKKRNEARINFDKQVKSYDSPIISFIHNYDFHNARSASKILTKDAERLAKGHNSNIYIHAGMLEGMLNGKLGHHIDNDYEYALWVMTSIDFKKWKEALKTEVGERYPAGAYIEFMEADEIKAYNAQSTNFSKRRSALQEVEAKYKGKAISLYAREKLILMELEECNSHKKEKEEDFLVLDNHCGDFLSDLKKLDSSEKALVGKVESVERIKKMLTSPALRIDMKGRDSVNLYFRNLTSATLSIMGEEKPKVVFKKKVSSPEKRFYIEKKVSLKLPSLDDGSYMLNLKKGKTEYECDAQFYTLSIAQRRNSEGFGIYVADCKTGEPLKSTDLHLYKNGNVISEAKDFHLLDGFTPIPENFEEKLSAEKWYDVQAVYRDTDGRLRKSEKISLRKNQEWNSHSPEFTKYGNIFLDQGAYHPGDEMKFKAILYKGNPQTSLEVLPEGTGVMVEIMDAENNVLVSIPLETDDFGAVSSKYTLPEMGRNGMFHMQIKIGGKRIAHKYFRVDDFVLPEFLVSFAPQSKLYAAGDEISVKGSLESYSGHPVSNTVISYQVECEAKIIAEGQSSIDESGEFRIRFQSLKDQREYGRFYHVKLMVTGGTGETHEYGTLVQVSGRIYLNTRIQNEAGENVQIRLEQNCKLPGHDYPLKTSVVTDDKICLLSEISRGSTTESQIDVHYQLLDEKGDTLKTGAYKTGLVHEVDMTGLKEGLYLISLTSETGRESIKEAHSVLGILKMDKNANSLNAPVKHFYSAWNTDLSEGKECGAMFGTADGPLWAVAELYGEGRKLLESRMIRLGGDRGDDNSLVRIGFEFKDDYPDVVDLQLFYFKEEGSEYFNSRFQRPDQDLNLPLEFTSFYDKTTPKTRYSFSIKTLPGVQCLAAIYDKSLDEIHPNDWERVYLQPRYPESVRIEAVCGSTHLNPYLMEGSFSNALDGAAGMKAYGVTRGLNVMAKSSMMMESDRTDEGMMNAGEEDLVIRSDFSTSLTFQPFLKSDEEGKIDLQFETSEKLSTFVVSLFAHNTDMQNELLRKEMVVTQPLKVAVAEPSFLYDGDEWNMTVSVSSNLREAVSGTLSVQLFAGTDYEQIKPYRKTSARISLPAGGSTSEQFEIPADLKRILRQSESGKLGIRVSFLSDDKKLSDGIFMAIPVLPATQKITESHSMLIRPDSNRKEIWSDLRSRFINGSGNGALSQEISILDMVKAAIPSKLEQADKDVLSMSETIYMRLLAESLGASAENTNSVNTLFDKIMNCRNADGGFAWFEGMESSPIITAVILERFSKLEKAGLLRNAEKALMDKTVKYLDNVQFNTELPYWCGAVSDANYLYVRSLYPSVKFEPQRKGSLSLFNKKMEEFKESTRAYLIPKGDRGLKGELFMKARRLMTLANLSVNEEGLDLAQAWGVPSNSKLSESMFDDMTSLQQYAIEHEDGGWYYPNLVMPFRGLLESEAYAHSMMCDLMSRFAERNKGSEMAKKAEEIADGIRLWLMIQKETQQWDKDPGFIDAINSIMAGSDELKSASIAVLTQSYTLPLEQVKASGNGMEIKRGFYKEVKVDGKTEYRQVTNGEELHIGDKIVAKYIVHNDENRSFGKLTAWRESNLVPVHQLSGIYSLGILSGSNPLFRFAPMSYRDVRSDRSVFYMNVMPEENFEMEEEFFVSRAGVFKAPAVEIESQYAPHYRANGNFDGNSISR